MALKVVRSTSSRTLFNACASAFLDETGDAIGPACHPAHLWLTHRNQRDLLLGEAIRRGLRGWLNPPFHFFSALPELFGVRARPIGLLARRERISRIGYEVGRRFGINVGNADASITRGHMLDSLLGELLAEGITPAVFESALAQTQGDEFAGRRNAWLLASYAAYLAELQELGIYDPRAIHALVADRIDAGGLPAALGGAHHLHVYGLYSARSRGRLLTALGGQATVEVVLYTTAAAADLTAFASSVEDLPRMESLPVVQPAPDANREFKWVAREVKKLLLSGAAEPHEVAVVARTGIEDTRRARFALQRAGVPATARTRTSLVEIAALKALLDLFRAAAERWSYRVLRSVLASPYFRTRIDLRPFDHIATQARPETLAAWEDQLIRLIERLEAAEPDRDAKQLGLSAERVRRDLEHFRLVRAVLEPLDGDKPLERWLDLIRNLLQTSWFRFRQRICDLPEERRDIVRLDQRGVRMLERLLDDWASIDDRSQLFTPIEWFRALRALLEGQELVLTTPGQKGVQVLEAHDAALVPFHTVFLVHANDGEFPRFPATTGIFSDDERRRLRAAGLPVDDRGTALARECALWAAVVGSERVHISYRTTDARGTPLLPALLVPVGAELPELPRREALLDDPVNAEEDTRAAAWKLAGQVARGDASPIHAPDPGALQRAILNAYAERMRGAPDRTVAGINPWNGELRDPVVLAWLAERYGAEHFWSASQLEAYTAAPFVFLLERVLGLEQIAEADEDTDRLTSGGVKHAVLERFYRNYVGKSPPEFGPTVTQQLVDICAQVFTEWQRSGTWLGMPALWEQHRVAVLELLNKYVEWDLAELHKRGQRVWCCEHEIGGGEFVELTGRNIAGEEVRMRLRGRIDRVDQDRAGQLTVIDYKSSTTPQGMKGYDDGSVLQGPLYVAALRAEGEPAESCIYRSLKKLGNAAELERSNSEYDRALQIAFSAPARVRRGLFEAVMASTLKWKDWHPGLAVRRTHAQRELGSRFDD